MDYVGSICKIARMWAVTHRAVLFALVRFLSPTIDCKVTLGWQSGTLFLKACWLFRRRNGEEISKIDRLD